MWLDHLDNSGVPVLVCLTHADKFYANECLRELGKDCPKETAKRIIGKELERIKDKLGNSPNRTVRFYSFCQDSDSFLDCDEGRETLREVGICDQKDAGDWLEEELRKRIKQQNIANKLHRFLESEDVSDDSMLPSSTETDECHETIQELKSQSTFPLPIASNLRAVTVCGERNDKVTGDNGHCIDWPEYGFKMEIPPGALPADDNCTIAIKAITSGHFNIPQHSEVVSAYYWIYSSRKFLKPVDVQLHHCARLSNDEDCSQMQFIIARCDQKELPYKFSIKDGVFSPKNRQGLISLTKFSITAIIRKMFNSSLVEPTECVSRPLNDCYYVYAVFGRKLLSQYIWQFDIIITKDICPYLKAIDNKYSRDSWIEDTPPTSFEFEEESILILPPPKDSLPGWKYVFKCSQKIKKSYVDRCEENTTQQSCRIAFRWIGKGEPQLTECIFQLQGAVDIPVITLVLPIDNPTNRSSTDYNSPTQFGVSTSAIQTRLSSATEKEITSRPTIRELISEVAAPALDKWRMIGVELGIDAPTLNSIEQQHRNPNDYYFAIFEIWLRMSENPQWETILQVLVTPAVGRPDLALKIREKHSDNEK